jgi:hypothetical protein
VPASVKAPVAITPKTSEVLEASMNESVSDLGGVDAVASPVMARTAAAAVAAKIVLRMVVAFRGRSAGPR